MAHKPALRIKRFERYPPVLQERAEDLFLLVQHRIGEKLAVIRQGSYSFFERDPPYTTPKTYAKIIIRDDEPHEGVYLLLRADGTLDAWLEHEPWTRADPQDTVRVISVAFYAFRLRELEDASALANGIADVIRLDEPPAP